MSVTHTPALWSPVLYLVTDVSSPVLTRWRAFIDAALNHNFINIDKHAVGLTDLLGNRDGVRKEVGFGLAKILYKNRYIKISFENQSMVFN